MKNETTIRHIEILQKRLDNIYQDAVDGQMTNVRTRLTDLERLEKIYAVVESDAFVKEGSTYDEYSTHLKSVREKIAVLSNRKQEIETYNSSEITNIGILLKAFQNN